MAATSTPNEDPNASRLDISGNLLSTGKPPVVPAPTSVPDTGGSAKTPATTVPSASTSAPDTKKAANPVPSNYTVASGDTLTTIAQKYGTNVQALLGANPSITNPNNVQAGSSLTLPGEKKLTTAPGNLGDVSKAVYTAVKAVPDQTDTGAVTSAGTAAAANLGATDPVAAALAPFIENMSAAVQAIVAPAPTYESLTNEYQDLVKSSGLESLNTQMMNLKNVMDGTEDDIRAEVTASGGFASDSQVQALATSRNKVLIKQYNALAGQQAVAQDFVDNTMKYETADQSERDNQQSLAITKINDATGIESTMATLVQSITSNAQKNYQNIIGALPNGVAGLAQILAGDPSQLTYAESALGLPQGSLSDPAKIAQINQQYQNAALQKEANTIYTNTGAYPAWWNPITGTPFAGATLNPDGTVSGGTSTGSVGPGDSSTVVGGIQFGSANGVGAYATDINSEVSGVSRAFADLQGTDIGTYIQNNAPSSPVTAAMISNAAQANGIDPNILAATLMNESKFGTAGAGASTMNPGNVGNIDDGSTQTMDSWQQGVNAAAQQLARRKTANTEPVVSSNSVGNDNQGRPYSISSDAGKALVAKGATTDAGTNNLIVPGIGYYVQQKDGSYKLSLDPDSSEGQYEKYKALAADPPAYKPMGSLSNQRMTRNALTRQVNAALTQYVNNPVYQNVSSGAAYLSKLQAGLQNPGSVGDPDIIDSLVKINTGGQGAITEQQYAAYSQGQSWADRYAVENGKIVSKGGTLSPDQRQGIADLASDTFANYEKQYKVLYTQAMKNLENQSIPPAFWGNMPDWNNLISGKTINILPDTE